MHMRHFHSDLHLLLFLGGHDQFSRFLSFYGRIGLLATKMVLKGLGINTNCTLNYDCDSKLYYN